MEELEGILELDKSAGIYIDIGTQVYIEIEGVNFSVSSIFIGMLRDEFMIVTLPKRYKSVKSKLYPSNKMIVKYLYEGSIYAFQTSVIETIVDPIKALAIEYPRVVQEKELRNVRRNNVVIPGRVEAKNSEFSVVVYDLSRSGGRFKYFASKSSITPLREGDLLRLHCAFPGVLDEVGTMACVRNVKRDGGELFIGIEFQGPTKDFVKPLMQFLYFIEDFS